MAGSTSVDAPVAVRWSEDGRGIDLLDQTALPETELRLRLETRESVADAIRDMKVRGAPAIGVTAAMGLALDLAQQTALAREAFLRRLEETSALLLGTRPTAANLRWALNRMRKQAAASAGAGSPALACMLMGEASRILEEDRAMCWRIGQHGLALIPAGARVLTHCNAGALATGGIGTALAPIYLAHAEGRAVHVYAGETRPLLQGSRLTAWELMRAGVRVTLIADVVAGRLMQEGAVDMVMVGADRIAANGDVANKIGTYPLAVLAERHGIPFYVAAPGSTLDLALTSGAEIPIEERSADEVRRGFGRQTAPADVQVHAPAFDITPADLVTAIVTDTGVQRAPYATSLAAAARASLVDLSAAPYETAERPVPRAAGATGDRSE